MQFPPRLLDEIRERLPVSQVVGRRVRLAKKGREWMGLCPFHREKTPSFTVNDDKAFFHCFGCGAHGDVIGFTMQIDNLPFPEAVERLVHEAGLEMPRASPQEIQREERAKTLGDVVEAACAWFEAQLRAPAGRAALDYLRGRGLIDATIKRFRLGYAPDDRQALRKHLLGLGFAEAQLAEASLTYTPDGGGDPFVFFRDRVIFPIRDRRGRPIAFGGRVLGDAKPKYLNSRDTPLFDKGRTLYALDLAREAVRGAADKPAAALIVAEGYMDVIALHQAGFGGAVAPLGTALTETQIEELWRLVAEPIICLDGDAAGRRAALRAAERAVPLLKPGKSLRFALLPEGEDPDSLIRRDGPGAVTAVLGGARALADILWDHHASRPLETPEQRAALEAELEKLAATIADKTVQWEYRRLFRARVRARGFTLRQKPATSGARASADMHGAQRFEVMRHLRRVIDDPSLLGFADGFDRFEALHVDDPDLEALRREIVLVAGEAVEIDPTHMRAMLLERGHGPALSAVMNPRVSPRFGLSQSEADLRSTGEVAARQMDAQIEGRQRAAIERDLVAAQAALAEEPTLENLARVEHLKREIMDARERDQNRDLFD